MQVHKCVIKLTRTVAKNMSDHEFKTRYPFILKIWPFCTKNDKISFSETLNNNI